MRLAAGLAAVACLGAAPATEGATPFGDPSAPARSGRTLTSDQGGWLCVGGCAFAYRWQRCAATCSTVSGRTGPSYLLTTPDIGTRIRSVVTATDLVGSGTSASAQSGVIAPAPPVNVTPPLTSGVGRVGATLSATAGVWEDPSPASVVIARHWLRCTTTAAGSCAPVSAAPTYVLGAADVGRFIRRRETAEGLGAATAFSAPLGAIVSPPAAPAGVPFTSGGNTPAPARRNRVRPLRPFPVVVIAGRLRRGRTLVSEFTVRGPRGARVRVRCRGRGCPFRRISRTIGRRKRLRVRAAERSYTAGIVIEVRVTRRNRIGKFTRIRFRRRGAPARRDACLSPGATRASRCGR